MVIALDFRPLVVLDGVFNGQGVEAEDFRQQLGGLLAVDIDKQAVSTIGNNDKLGNLEFACAERVPGLGLPRSLELGGEPVGGFGRRVVGQ